MDRIWFHLNKKSSSTVVFQSIRRWTLFIALLRRMSVKIWIVTLSHQLLLYILHEHTYHQDHFLLLRTKNVIRTKWTQVWLKTAFFSNPFPSFFLHLQLCKLQDSRCLWLQQGCRNSPKQHMWMVWRVYLMVAGWMHFKINCYWREAGFSKRLFFFFLQRSI